MTTADRIPAPVLVLCGIVSVQFGGALAQTLVPVIGAGGSVTVRLLFATLLLLVIARPRWRGHSRRAWATVVAFGVALGLMNFAFYGSLAHLPIGVAVTIEFIGPLALAAALSRRLLDGLAVLAAAGGVVLISEALHVPFADLEWTGIGLALTAGAFWAAYIVLSGRTGAEFPQLEGLALAMVVATVVTLPFGVASIPGWTPAVLAKGLGIAVMSSVLPYSLELLALRRLKAQVFGILLSLEPAFAALAGLLVLGQHLRATQLVGMALVVAASALVLGLGARRDPAETAAT
ncbi:EamA family transporter [Phycicoccus duodecadis]|uniref:Inner membrane transporter RhtA n=1 Tax=Phycicoccus duodecadis TaxID=173053 RepID=A0A2N3YEF7_9MICO|nr:EamA family transporter [Phycicoccus duodecadis]PKW25227.1 inner membrane transporter RhtA [Phycicoccus duodecadis]